MASRAENLNQLNLEIADIHREWCNDGPDCIGEGCELLESLLTVIPFASPPAPDAALREAAQAVVRIKQAADGGVALISNQGQAMDGYSELANYRSAARELEAALNPEPTHDQ